MFLEQRESDGQWRRLLDWCPLVSRLWEYFLSTSRNYVDLNDVKDEIRQNQEDVSEVTVVMRLNRNCWYSTCIWMLQKGVGYRVHVCISAVSDVRNHKLEISNESTHLSHTRSPHHFSSLLRCMSVSANTLVVRWDQTHVPALLSHEHSHQAWWLMSAPSLPTEPQVVGEFFRGTQQLTFRGDFHSGTQCECLISRGKLSLTSSTFSVSKTQILLQIQSKKGVMTYVYSPHAGVTTVSTVFRFWSLFVLQQTEYKIGINVRVEANTCEQKK